MKKYLLIISLSYVFFNSFGQNPYNDAVDLKRHILNNEFIPDTTNINEVAIILKPYLVSPPLNATKGNQILALLQQQGSPNYNSFIAPYINLSGVQSDLFKELPIPKSSEKKNLPIGGFDVTTIADGFAKFIVKRTKQELSIAFFEKFKDELNKYPDIQTIFPQTYIALSAIGDEIYMFEAYIQTLRESFEKDLASLPSNLPTIIENHKDYFDNMPDLKAMLLSSFYIAQSIQDKQHPGNIIEDFPVENFDKINNKNIKPSFQTLILLSTSLKSNTDGDNYWVPYSDLKKLWTDTILLKIYLGLLEQRAKMDNIIFVNFSNENDSLWKIIDNSHASLSIYKQYIKNIAVKIQSLETKIKGLKKINNDSLLFENYYSFVSGSIDLMKYLTQVENLPCFPKEIHIQDSTEKYFDIAQTSADIVIDVNRRNYASAIVNTSQLLSIVEIPFKMLKPKYQDKINRLMKEKDEINKDLNFLKRNPSDTTKCCYKHKMKQFKSKTKKIKKKNNTNPSDSIPVNVAQKVLKYGSFMAAVVQAKTSDEVAAAIETIALPAGSSRIKRESAFNVSLNAYCGLFAGQERTKFWSEPKYSYGVTAPIGVAVSWGHSAFPFTHGIKCGVSSTLFLSIVDIGSITTFRFTNDTATTVSKIQLKDIISPGLFLSWGIPKSPVSFNAGCQLTPSLKSVSSSANGYEARIFRFTVGICVDIPILNLATSSQ